MKERRWEERIVFSLFFLFTFSFLIPAACKHAPEALPKPEGTSYVFEADDKIIFKALSQVLKDRGFGEPRVEVDKGRLETDYMVQEDWRTKVVATIKKSAGGKEKSLLRSSPSRKTPAPLAGNPRSLWAKNSTRRSSVK